MGQTLSVSRNRGELGMAADQFAEVLIKQELRRNEVRKVPRSRQCPRLEILEEMGPNGASWGGG